MKKRQNIKKILLPLVTALILVFAMSVSVMAELVPPLKDYYCTFTTDKKMDSNFKTKDMYNQFAGMQPGDYTDIAIDIKNDNENTVDWYMTNDVIKTLEDTREADALSGGAYTYILTYKNNSGDEKTLFSSDMVSGDDVSPAGEGLHEATDALDEWFYLDTLAKDDGGVLTLRVALDGETQGNDYQDTLAELQMQFAVELRKTTENPPPEPEKPDKPKKETKKKKSALSGSSHSRGKVKTGDYTNYIPYLVAAAVSGLAFLLLAIYSLRERRRQRGGKA